MINKAKFYNAYRAKFGSLKQSTVDTLEAIIDEFNQHSDLRLDHAAYMLATVKHEVGNDMVPIVENMNYSAKRIMQVWPSRFKTLNDATQYAHNPEKLGNNVYANRLGNGDSKSGDGYRYRGRGIGAQFTGKVNYEKFGKMLNIDLVGNPDLAMDLGVGAKVLYVGSTQGLFTGVGLTKYINNNKKDYINARRVVNADVGLNGAKIAREAEKFEDILKSAWE